MIDMRWSKNDTFETASERAPFSELIRLALVAADAVRTRFGGETGDRFGGFAGHAAS